MGPRVMNIKGNASTGEANESVALDDEAKKKMEEQSGSGTAAEVKMNNMGIDSCEVSGDNLVMHGFEEEASGKIIRNITVAARDDGKLTWTSELSRESPAEGQEKDIVLTLVFIKDE